MSDGPVVSEEWTQGLRAAFPNVRVSWNRKLDVFEIEEQSMLDKNWYHVRFWAKYRPGKLPGFFPLPATPDPVIKLLRAIDLERFGKRGPDGFAALEGHLESSRKKWLLDQKKKWDEAGIEYSRDMAARLLGVRMTIGPGGPSRTRRRWTGSDNMRKYAAELAAAPRKRPDQSDPLKELEALDR